MRTFIRGIPLPAASGETKCTKAALVPPSTTTKSKNIVQCTSSNSWRTTSKPKTALLIPYAKNAAVVPKIAVVLRKAYGGAQAAMGVWPGMRTDLIFAWPLAEIATVGAEQSVDPFYAEELKNAPDPGQFRADKIREYREKYANPLVLASKSPFIHDVIEPRETRYHLIRSLELLRGKKVTRQSKNHGNIPL